MGVFVQLNEHTVFADTIPVGYMIAENGCWEWVGSHSSTGYGQIKRPHREAPVAAHRYVFELERGPIPVGLQLDHLCRNRNCVNPSHLEPVSHTENVRRGAVSNRASHCPRGHLRTPETYVKNPRGDHFCRICKRENDRRYKECAQ